MTTATVLYVLNNTDDSQRIVIQPRIFDGAGGVQRNTDLTLYGNGAPRWGERFNENFVRLMENFAVAESGGEDGVPGSIPVLPKGEIELAKGIGYGINNPVEGQTWFSKSRGTLFVYTSLQTDGGTGFEVGTPRWKPATHVLTVASDGERTAMFSGNAARPGELVYNQDAQVLQVFDGSVWRDAGGDLTGMFVQRDGANTPMTGALRLYANHTSFVQPNSDVAVSKFYVDNFALLKTGGTMSGILSMGNNYITNVTSPTPGNPAHNQYAATKLYVDNAIAGVGGGVTAHGALTGLANNDHPQYLLKTGGIGQTMTGPLFLIDPNPTQPRHAAHKKYVDEKLADIEINPDILLAVGTVIGYTTQAPTYVPFPNGYNHTNTFLVVSMRGSHYVSSSGSYHRCWVEGYVSHGYIVQCSQKSNDTPAEGLPSGRPGGRRANFWLLKTGEAIPGLITPPPPSTAEPLSDGVGGGGGGGGGGGSINPIGELSHH